MKNPLYLLYIFFQYTDHPIGQPLALASQKFAQAFWTKYIDLAALKTPEASTVQGSLETVDCALKIATITTSRGNIQELFDYLVVTTGLEREYPSSPHSITRENYLSELAGNLANLRDASKGVVVIGGGMPYPFTAYHSRSVCLTFDDL